MKTIEYRGEVLSGYVPDLPKDRKRCGGMLHLFFDSIGRVEIFLELPLDFCGYIMYNIITVKELLSE